MTASAIDPRPVTLTGRYVELVPLLAEHLPRAREIALQGDLFRWFPKEIRTSADLDSYFAAAFQAHQAGTEVPFATFERASTP